MKKWFKQTFRAIEGQAGEGSFYLIGNYDDALQARLNGFDRVAMLNDPRNTSDKTMGRGLQWALVSVEPAEEPDWHKQYMARK